MGEELRNWASCVGSGVFRMYFEGGNFVGIGGMRRASEGAETVGWEETMGMEATVVLGIILQRVCRVLVCI